MVAVGGVAEKFRNRSLDTNNIFMYLSHLVYRLVISSHIFYRLLTSYHQLNEKLRSGSLNFSLCQLKLSSSTSHRSPSSDEELIDRPALL